MIDRRRVSAQWFSGTILTGVCGAALMGGAVFASLDGETNFATVPEKVSAALRGTINSIGDKIAMTRKGDRLPPVSEYNAARQVVRDTRPVRVGDREIMRVHTFVRISANLSLSATELTASIPPFNPQKLMAAANANVTVDEQPGAEPDAEVSFVTRDLAGALPRMKLATTLQLDEVVARVRETANWTGNAVTPRFHTA